MGNQLHPKFQPKTEGLDPLSCEETGAHIGDGSMGIYQGRHIYSFCGNPKKDIEYVRWLATVFKKKYSVEPKIRFWSGVVGFQIFSKDVVAFKRSIGLPLGRKDDINIPDIISSSPMKCIAPCIRGIYDTDGVVYLEKKNSKLYPRIQLKVSSARLATTVHRTLNKKFDIRATLHWRQEKSNWKPSYFVECRGNAT